MNNKLLRVLACPICYRSLYFMKKRWRLICKFDSLSFEICNGIPIFFEKTS